MADLGSVISVFDGLGASADQASTKLNVTTQRVLALAGAINAIGAAAAKTAEQVARANANSRTGGGTDSRTSDQGNPNQSLVDALAKYPGGRR